MSDFRFVELKKEVISRFNEISSYDLFLVDLEHNQLFEEYLKCFPEDIRQEYNCHCCRTFLNHYGSIVAIKDNKLMTLWDFESTQDFHIPEKLRNVIINSKISKPFKSTFQKLGTNLTNHLKDGVVITNDHFFIELPKAKAVSKSTSIDTLNSEELATKQVFERSLKEITIDSLETVQELISQNSLYRGKEFEPYVSSFLGFKRTYDSLPEDEKELFVWSNYKQGGRIRNTVIGTLLTDISDGVELDQAVKSFETKVAPSNYKRPTALVTKGMIEQAEKTIKELGIENSLFRRYATLDDIPVEHLLFTNKDKLNRSLFDEMKEDVVHNSKTFSKVEEVSFDTFIEKILPHTTNLELLLETKHRNNFMTLVAPEYPDSESIFNWDSGLSWSYQDGNADSVKERVKRAGGTVEGALRISLEWFNYDDLDLSVIEPNGNKIFYSSKHSQYSGGFLDVDMNAGGGTSREAVENIIFKDESRMLEGTYQVVVHNFAKRESVDVGFNVEIEYNSETFEFSYLDAVPNGIRVNVVTFNYSRENGITFNESKLSLGSKTRSVNLNGLDTQKFHKVSMCMLSPNYWGTNKSGNQHTFFILENAINPIAPRGLFNEYLKPKFMEHRKVFEVLANKLKIPYSDSQLTGLGFSSTQRNEVIVRVTGAFTRVIKVKF